MMIKKVCFFSNYNLYESKRHFTKKLAEAMERQNIQTKIIDAEETSLDKKVLAEIQKFKPDFTASFNTLLPIKGTTFIWDLLKIPHLSILVDPSLYSVSVINSPYSIISCVDHFDCEGIRSAGFSNVFFWPHAIEKELSPGKEKTFDIVFLGSCCDYESLREHWKVNLPKGQDKVLMDAIDIVLSDNKTPLMEALVTAWNGSNLDPTTADLSLLFYYLDHYSRGKDRVELIRAIKNAPVHVFGSPSEDNTIEKNNWNYYLQGQKNVTLHPPVRYNECLEILKKSKICLNSMPFFKNGSHERLFNSFACGALPVTTDNLFSREQFVDGEEAILYLNPKVDEVDEKIASFLSDEKKREEAVAKGREKVMQRHTWDVRVQELSDAISPILKIL